MREALREAVQLGMVRAANRQEEAQQRQAHHFGHQHTIWKTEDVDANTGERVLKELKPNRWRQTEDGSFQAHQWGHR